MYALPLLIHGNPRTLSSSHPVRLKPGFWRVISKNLIDTLLVLTDGSSEYKLDEGFRVHHSKSHWLVIKSAGTERYITVMAEVYDGPVSS
jgi:hypothetical protein